LPAIKKAGIPIVQTLHDYKLICPNTSFVSQGEICERCKGHRYYQVVLRRCKRDSLAASLVAGLEVTAHKLLQIYEANVDIFITPSQFLKDKLIEHGIKNRIVHVPNFVDLARFQPEYEKSDYFVYYGRLVAIKGVYTLLRAMQDVPNSHLHIAGHGEAEGEVRRLIDEYGLRNVTLLGHLEGSELTELIQKARFTVVPSEWYENYSMTVIESLACGTPVIGSRIGGIVEQVRDGVNGLLFEPGNAAELAEKIHELLDNPERARSMSVAGRQQVEQINDPQYYYEATMALYQSLLVPQTDTPSVKRQVVSPSA
jgi:glycosyltransferase involved in cell wall biosynthesis